MFLIYGVTKEKRLIAVNEVNRGLHEDLFCPYCGVSLIAKKGRIKNAHFAHNGKTCNPYSIDIYGLNEKHLYLSIPEFDKRKRDEIASYKEKLKGEQTEKAKKKIKAVEAYKFINSELEKYSKPYKNGKYPKNRAKNKKVLLELKRYIKNSKSGFPELQKVRHSSFCSYTSLANRRYVCSQRDINFETGDFIPTEFIPHYKPLYYYHQRIKYKNDSFANFCLEINRIKSFKVYFLKIILPHKSVYKIGITSREISKRINEIKATLKQKYDSVNVEILYKIKGHVYIEAFFKSKYKMCKFLELPKKTEYFDFENINRPIFFIKKKYIGKDGWHGLGLYKVTLYSKYSFDFFNAIFKDNPMFLELEKIKEDNFFAFTNVRKTQLNAVLDELRKVQKIKKGYSALPEIIADFKELSSLELNKPLNSIQ